jgi:alkaline phosphatase
MRAAGCGLAVAMALAGCATTAPAPDGAGASAQASIEVPAIQRPGQESAAWWFRAGSASANAHGAGRAQARNLILFVGDGMSLPTVAAARILEGQREGGAGEEHRLSFEEFPWTALSRTYNTDSQTPDSAGTMTAMATGAKTRIGMLSVGQQLKFGECAPGKTAELSTLLEIASAAGLATGVVTTTRITHATPAATYAHASDRGWENDTELSQAARDASCKDIARQFLEAAVGAGPDVAMGGGRANFLPVSISDPEYPAQHGLRGDGRDLVSEWQARHPEGRYVWNAAQLAALDPAQTPRLLALFEPDHMHYEHERRADGAGEPSLAEMTRAAIARLRGNPRGFVLMVEGGKIDHAHHAGNAFRALDETIAFSDAVRTARSMTSEADTLVLVTADHAHTLSFVGYPRRGNPILGKVVEADAKADDDYARDALGLPYTTLSYANGPGYAGASEQQPEGPKRYPHEAKNAQPARVRPDLAAVDTTDPDYEQEAIVPLGSETHGGDDVGVWASGPGAEAVHGSIEQNEIFHLLLQAQPELRALLCRLGDCEQGVPVRSPALEKLREAAQARPLQAR